MEMVGGRKDSASGRGGAAKKTPPASQKTPYICLKCEDALGENDEVIECHGCKDWCHKACSSLTAAQYSCLQGGGNFIQWFCQKCRGKEGEEQSRTRLEAQMAGLMRMMMTVTEKLGRLEAEYSSQKKIEEKIEKIVDKKVQEYLEEKEEKEKRKLNIIVCNLPESTEENPEARKEDDMDRVRDLITTISDVPGEDINNPVRLGQIQIGSQARPRLLRMEVRNEESKKKILQNASKLRKHKPNTASKDFIYINNDYTPKQRDHIKELRQELKKRTDDGEKDLMISYRDFKIVKRMERGFLRSGPDAAGAAGDRGQGPSN